MPQPRGPSSASHCRAPGQAEPSPRPGSRSEPPMRDPTLAVDDAHEAVLVADSRSEAMRFHVRSSATTERRLLFQAPEAHIELRIAPARAAGEPAWLYGMFVPLSMPAGTGRVRVRLSADGIPANEVEAMETGEFALPCVTDRGLSVRFTPPGGGAVRVRIEA